MTKLDTSVISADTERRLVLLHVIVPLFATLFFMQSVRVFIGRIYFENLAIMELGASVAYVFLLLSPVFVLLLRRANVLILSSLLAGGVILFRLILAIPLLPSSVCLLVAGMSTALYTMYLPAAAVTATKGYPSEYPTHQEMLASGLALGIAADTMLRIFGVSWDPTVGYYGAILTVLMTVIAFVLLFLLLRERGNLVLVEVLPPRTKKSRLATASLGLGFGGGMFLILCFLAFPNVIARWTGSSYELATIAVVLALALYPALLQIPGTRQLIRKAPVVVVLNLLLLLAMLDIAFLHSPLAGLISGLALFATLVDVHVLWSYIEQRQGNLSDSAAFHLMGMTALLLLMLLYVLSLVAGQLITALLGIAPYIIVTAFILLILSSLTAQLALVSKEVTR